MSHLSNNSVRDHMKWAGLLGCEAVLSSMALMQAGSMPNHRKMNSHLGHGQRENNHSQNHNNNHNHNQDTQNQHGHMLLPSGISCPPLLICKDGEFHSSRLLDEKDMQASQNVQPKKKNRKSGLPSKMREKPQMEMPDVNDDNSISSQVQKNFICEHCYSAFRSSYHLKRHILTHTGEKPFGCDMCDMRFIQRYHLERHKRVHSGEKPYQCDRCQQNRPVTTTSAFVCRGGPKRGEPAVLRGTAVFSGPLPAHGFLEPTADKQQQAGGVTTI
ncbi:Zinc finger protein 740 [Triplophysa tibetana]|uniref:Zinc finger protein 740 n=1 Tax=Triplophysa tibetana TaxID=1572043 RepID=A0A5A9NBF0_9TELE|nr:Zinc finger protein 740 [Triplophysa tibetana]